jgi:hypothetical protein
MYVDRFSWKRYNNSNLCLKNNQKIDFSILKFKIAKNKDYNIDPGSLLTVRREAINNSIKLTSGARCTQVRDLQQQQQKAR